MNKRKCVFLTCKFDKYPMLGSNFCPTFHFSFVSVQNILFQEDQSKWTLYFGVITVFCVKIRTYSVFWMFYKNLFIFWYILNELDIQTYHYEVYFSTCQTCTTVVIVLWIMQTNQIALAILRKRPFVFDTKVYVTLHIYAKK